MKIQELKTKTGKELNTILSDLKKEQMNLRFQKASGELKNTSRVRIVRKAIARISTLFNQKNSAE